MCKSLLRDQEIQWKIELQLINRRASKTRGVRVTDSVHEAKRSVVKDAGRLGRRFGISPATCL